MNFRGRCWSRWRYRGWNPLECSVKEIGYFFRGWILEVVAGDSITSPPDPAKLNHVSVWRPVRRLPVAASAAPSGAAAAATERKRFRERYGLNPDDFEEDAEEDPRVRSNLFELTYWLALRISRILMGFFFQEESRDRRRQQQSGRGEQTVEAAVTPAKVAEPRETHKMLQVWTETDPLFWSCNVRAIISIYYSSESHKNTIPFSATVLISWDCIPIASICTQPPLTH